MPKHPFVQHLCTLAETDNRGALAQLRRGLGKEPGTVAEMFPHVVPWIPGNAYRREQDNYYLVASLFALHSKHTDKKVSLGAAMHQVARQGSGGEGTERRFTALLNSHENELAKHLRHAVSLAKSKDVAMNYELLLQHMNHWTHPERWVQRRWASDFWSRSAEEDENKDEDNKEN